MNVKKTAQMLGVNQRRFILLAIDIAAFLISYVVMAFVNSMSSGGANITPKLYALNAVLFVAMLFGMRFLSRLYHNIWRYADFNVYLTMMAMDVLGGIAAILISYILHIYIGLWVSVAIVCSFMIITIGLRMCYQQYRYYRRILQKGREQKNKQICVAIVGTGQLAALLVKELRYNPRSHYKPVCFIDNQVAKVGSLMCGIPIYSESGDIAAVLKTLEVEEVFIALAHMTPEVAKYLYDRYSVSGRKVKIYEFPMKDLSEESEPGKGTIRELKIEDLLFRSELSFTDDATDNFYRGKRVLVTGGGGSIGSELCRQIAMREPEQLIILDIYENNAYEIQQELIRKYGDGGLNMAVEIASVRDRVRLEAVFARYRPQIVFHAAAHKHVPLMEHSNCEAIKNNVMGTFNTADMAEKYGAEKFILISTDKAVNPTNIMGASKRMCEMVVQCRVDSKTSFAAVRFGNVLGSNGSVIPLFKHQIMNGGPVTVTDKRIIRYFMTIPEASQLLLSAGAMAKRGELFVLNMGKPVRILELAENMIKLSGYKPYEDIDIVEIGLRPGEKLYEELLIKTEELDKTSNSMIFVEKDKPLSRAEVDAKVKLLGEAVKASETELESPKVRTAMKQAVPTFREPEEINKAAIESEEMKAVERSEDDFGKPAKIQKIKSPNIKATI